MTGNIVMGANKVTSTATPSADADLTTKVYVDSILGSATSAATSASAAATSATNASNSASAASSSASAASASASSAAASYDSFDDRYLGPKSSAPSVDNDGNTLLTGALYWNSTSSNLWVWSGSAWTQATLTAGSFATLAGTETLTNKTITFADNTLTNVASINTAQTFTGTKTFTGTSSQSMTVAFLVTQGATAYYNSAVQVDGTTSGVTTRWLGGAPTAGNASGIDSYRYLIIKTGSATFTVLASVTQFKA